MFEDTCCCFVCCTGMLRVHADCRAGFVQTSRPLTSCSLKADYALQILSDSFYNCCRLSRVSLVYTVSAQGRLSCSLYRSSMYQARFNAWMLGCSIACLRVEVLTRGNGFRTNASAEAGPCSAQLSWHLQVQLSRASWSNGSQKLASVWTVSRTFIKYHCRVCLAGSACNPTYACVLRVMYR
jgi:hypothetical protein